MNHEAGYDPYTQAVLEEMGLAPRRYEIPRWVDWVLIVFVLGGCVLLGSMVGVGMLSGVRG